MSAALRADTLDAAITEREWARTVTDALSLYGFLWVHYRPARTKNGWRTPLEGHAGAPDVFAVKDGRVLWLELKTERGRITLAQEEWLTALRDAGQEAMVLRPRDWTRFLQLLRPRMVKEKAK